MLDGVIQQVATPLELYNKPVNKFVAGFIGSPPMNMVSGTLVAENGNMCFRDDKQTIALNVHASHRQALDSHVDKKIILGIRPEDMHDNPDQSPIDGKSIAASVDVVEPMGSEIYLYLDLGGQTATARVKTDEEPEVNKQYVLDIDMAKAHFFDADTEETLV